MIFSLLIIAIILDIIHKTDAYQNDEISSALLLQATVAHFII